MKQKDDIYFDHEEYFWIKYLQFKRCLGFSNKGPKNILLFLMQYVKHQTVSGMTKCIPYKLRPSKTIS